jgi:hypothetical protein
MGRTLRGPSASSQTTTVSVSSRVTTTRRLRSAVGVCVKPDSGSDADSDGSDWCYRAMQFPDAARPPAADDNRSQTQDSERVGLVVR